MIKWLPLVPCLIFLWLALGAFQELWLYWSLSTAVNGSVEKVEPVPYSASKFGLEAHYKFSFEGKPQKGKCLLNQPYYLNRFSAEEAARALEGKPHLIWVNPSHPGASALEKHYPYKKIIYSIISLALAGYFYFLARSVEYKANKA